MSTGQNNKNGDKAAALGDHIEIFCMGNDGSPRVSINKQGPSLLNSNS